MRAKHWLALFLVVAMAASLAIIPVTAEENLLAGTGSLTGDTVSFSVTADRGSIIYTGGEEVITFTVNVANDSEKALHAFSFTLEPSEGLTLATERKRDEASGNPDFYFCYGTDQNMLKYYNTFDYIPDRGYFAAAKADRTSVSDKTEGKSITRTTGAKEVLTIMGKISAPDDYTLTMNTTDKDKVVVAGQVNGTGKDESQYFKRVVSGATVQVEAGGVISGTVVDDNGTAIADADVTLKNGDNTVATAKTDANGTYTLPAVVNGAYTLDVTAQAEDKTLRGSKSVTVNGSQENGYAFNGDVTVKEGIPGDVNGDFEIDSRDLTRLCRYLAEYPVDINLIGADANGDGEIDSRDLTRLSRYLAEYDVVLG